MFRVYFFRLALCRTRYLHPCFQLVLVVAIRHSNQDSVWQIQYKRLYWAHWLSWHFVHSRVRNRFARVIVSPVIFVKPVDSLITILSLRGINRNGECLVDLSTQVLASPSYEKKIIWKRHFSCNPLGVVRSKDEYNFVNSCGAISRWWLTLAFSNFLNSVEERNSVSDITSTFFSDKKYLSEDHSED